MEQSRWFRAAIVLISLTAIVFLASAVGRLWTFMGDLIMIVFFAWLVGSLLIHFVNSLMHIPHMRRPLAILLVYLALVTLLANFIFLVVPATISQVQDLVVEVPEHVETIQGWITNIDSFLVARGVDINLSRQFDYITDDPVAQVTNFLTENVVPILQGVASALFAIGLVLALAFYIVIDGGRRMNQALKVLPPAWEQEVHWVLRTFDATFHGYMRGLLVVSLIYGVGTALVLTATGLPLALPTAIISSLLLAVPFIGDWLALALPLIIALTAGDFFTFIVVFAVLLFIQQVMLNLLTPRILGRAVRMPAMLVIVSVVMGARLAGIWGALLGVPAAAVLYSLAVTYGTRIQERRAAKEAHLIGAAGLRSIEKPRQQQTDADQPTNGAAAPDGVATISKEGADETISTPGESADTSPGI
jgi:predicted PurR-regulated permease PerM